jgi:hypothetical protein
MTTPATGVLDPTEVQVGTANGPGIYIAPAGTAGPADTTEDWDAPWAVLGYLSDDGPTVAQSTDTEDITPWQSVVPIRTVITSRGVTLQFTMWQLNAATLALYFDCDVPAVGSDGSVDFDVRTDSPQHIYAVGIDSADADRVLRIVFPRASLSDAGDMQLQRGAAVPLDVTLSALDDAGNLARITLGPAASASGLVAQSAEEFVANVQTVGARQTGAPVPEVSKRAAAQRSAKPTPPPAGTGGE